MTASHRIRLAFPVFVLPAIAVAQSVDLRPRIAPDHDHYIQIKSDVVQTINVSPDVPPMKIHISEATGFTERTGPAGGDGTIVAVQIEHRMMKFDAPGMATMTFDSDVDKLDENNSASLISAPWIDRRLRFNVAPDGTVTEVDGFDALHAAVDDAAMGDMIYEQMSGRFTRDLVTRELIGQRFEVYPDEPVEPGATWTRTHEQELPNIGKISTTFNVKFDSLGEHSGRKAARLTYTFNTQLTEAADSPMGSISLRTAEGKGETHVCLETRLPVAVENHQTWNMVVTPAGMEEGMAIKVDTSTGLRTMTAEDRAARKKAAAGNAPN